MFVSRIRQTMTLYGTLTSESQGLGDRSVVVRKALDKIKGIAAYRSPMYSTKILRNVTGRY